MKRIKATIWFCLVATILFSQNIGKLSFKIDGYGNIESNVSISFDTISNENAVRPIYILLPFRVSSDLNIKIQDDIIYSFEEISKKYTLLNILHVSELKKISFSIYSVDLQLPTIEGKSKIEVDFNYDDIPRSLSLLLNESFIYYKFDIEWVPPRKLQDEEITFSPAGFVNRNQLDGFEISYKNIQESDNKAWFVYPNFKGGKDKEIQLYLLLLIGILTGLAQLNPIIERKATIIKYQAIIGGLILLILIVLFIALPKSTLASIKTIAAPILPHILYILGGLIYLKITNNLLVKISGIVRDENNDPLKFADIELYEITQDVDNDKPFRSIIELNNGRFVFSFIQRKKKSYKLKISKNNRETKIIDIPDERDKSYELESPVKLEKLPTT